MTELYLSGGDTLQSVDHPTWQGQTFVLQKEFILQFVDLEMRGAMRINKPVIQLFHANIDGSPFGPPLSRDRYIVEKKSGVFTTGRVRFSMQPYFLQFPARFVLIVANFPPLGGNHASWQYDKSDATYPRGIRISSPDGGATWTPHYNDDFMFALFGSPPLILPEPPPPLDNFAATLLDPFHSPTSITFILATSVPCHLFIHITETPPRKYMTSRVTRGLAVPWHVYYSFVEWYRVEQTELGDTMTHTFEVPNWKECQTKWFTFRGKVDNIDSPSVGPIFKHHHPGITTDTEQQILYNTIISIADFLRAWAGQRLTISNRTVTKLAFVLNKFGSPTGDVTFQIRRVSDDSILAQKVWGSAALLQPEGSEQWEEVEFDTPVFINEEVRIVVYYPDSVSNFRVRQHYQNTDVKPSEQQTFRNNDTWTDSPTADCAYRYTFYT